MGSIPCLQMHWLLKSPEHQQACYWLCRTKNMYCCTRINSISLGIAKSRKWFKMWIYLYNIYNNSVCKEFKKYLTCYDVKQCLEWPTQPAGQPWTQRLFCIWGKKHFKHTSLVRTLLSRHHTPRKIIHRRTQTSKQKGIARHLQETRANYQWACQEVKKSFKPELMCQHLSISIWAIVIQRGNSLACHLEGQW